jgi:eukaryotic-like serine/threonine-protein kinase
MLNEGMFIADRYEVLGRIGAGGMSDVYKAKDHVLGRFVAIKVLKAEFSEDTNFVTKFRTEAQSAAGLEHPNVVNIYDVGSEDGMYYIVMEYIEGITLKTYIEKKGRLSYKEAISIAIQMGRGIEAAHNKNIVHRDIKPQNIMISTEGKVKVADFGIAKAASNNTIHSDVMGSVHYTSPEQAKNGYVDCKSDIYSLGIVMYEMVTGRVPFDGDTAVAVAIQHLQEEMVPPSVLVPDIPISLEKIILKCTQKSVDRRYRSMSEVLADLKHALMSPDEDFVQIMDGSNSDRTIVMPSAEVKQASRFGQQGQSPDLILSAKQTEHADHKSMQEDLDGEETDDGEEEEEEGLMNAKMEKTVTIIGVVAAIVIVLMILYLIGSFFGLFQSSSSDATTQTTQTETQTETETETEEDGDLVTMIDVTGMDFDDAKNALNEIELGIFEEGEQSSTEYAEGKIISQSVEEGEKVDKNTTVKVIVSSGEGKIAIPDVVGKSKTEAEETLTDEGFKYTEDYVYSDTVEEGYVASQTPSANSHGKKGDTITIHLSKGKELKNFTMPNYEGQAQDAVVNELKNTYGCTVTVNQEYSTTYAAGIVVGQSVTPGTTVAYQSSITIAVSKGAPTYSYSAKINAPTNASADNPVTSANITVTDANGTAIFSQTWIPIEAFPYSISVTGSTSTGKLNITWNLKDGTTSQQTQDITLTQAS